MGFSQWSILILKPSKSLLTEQDSTRTILAQQIPEVIKCSASETTNNKYIYYDTTVYTLAEYINQLSSLKELKINIRKLCSFLCILNQQTPTMW